MEQRPMREKQKLNKVMTELWASHFFFGKVKTKNEESRIASLIGKNHMQFFLYSESIWKKIIIRKNYFHFKLYYCPCM